MESNNSNNNNGGDGQQQLRRSARIRKLNKMANEEDKQARGEVQPELQDCSSSNKKKRKEDRNELDLEVYIYFFVFWIKKSEKVFRRWRVDSPNR
jgi:hypothetical protein